MRILVTGSTGMVGRNLLNHPKASNYEILAPQKANLNLLSFENVVEYLSQRRPDLIIHLAGKVGGIKANIADPYGFFSENLVINYNVIKGAEVTGVNKLINLGSSCMYPKDAKNPLKEDQILAGFLEPTNEGYALSKIVAQRMCAYISNQSQNFKYKTIIPCNLYGPFDKFDAVNAHLISAVIRKIHVSLKEYQPNVTIWGDGSSRREFMYVEDLVELLWDACDRFDSLPALMNAGIGHDHSVLEYYENVANVLGYSGDFSFDINQPVGMAQKLVCSRKANDWGWKAQTDLLVGIEKTYEYYLGTEENE
jgi:GDP-L-fucose synthase